MNINNDILNSMESSIVEKEKDESTFLTFLYK